VAGETGVVIPEAVVLEFQTAGIASRLLAATIDTVVQGVLLVAVVMGLVLFQGAGIDLFGLQVALGYVLVFLVIFGYPAAMETLWRGRTLGKAALGLRVVTVEGGPVRFRHAAIRSIMQLVDKVFPVAPALPGTLAVLASQRNQRLGDMVAGTLVLRERSAAGRATAFSFIVPPALEPYASTLDVSALGHQDYGAVRSFLLRAATLPPQVRHDLARTLAMPLVARLHTTPPPHVDPELFLLCVAALHQRRFAPTTPAGTGPATLAAPQATMASVWAATEVPSGTPGPAAAPSGAPSAAAPVVPHGPGPATAGGFVAPG